MGYLGKNLRDFIRRRRLTETAAGKLIGVNQATVNRLIKEDSSRKIENPSQATINKVAKLLGVSADAAMNTDLEMNALGVQEEAAPYSDGASQPVGWPEATLSVALVAVEKAIRQRGLDPEYGWGHLAGLVIWACELQGEQFPDGVKSKGEKFAFDMLVQQELEDRWGHGFGSTEQAAGQRTEKRKKAAPPRAKVRSGG